MLNREYSVVTSSYVPNNSSDFPCPYMSAVSKKFTPPFKDNHSSDEDDHDDDDVDFDDNSDDSDNDDDHDVSFVHSNLL